MPTPTPFDNHQIRSVYDTNTNKHYFSVVDICAAICGTGYQSARNYWKWLKNKLALRSNPLVMTTKQLKFESQDGKLRFTDVMDVDDVLRLIQLFPSGRNENGSGDGNRIEDFRLWIAELVISGRSVVEGLLAAIRKVKNTTKQRVGGFMRTVKRKYFDVGATPCGFNEKVLMKSNFREFP